MRAVSLLPSATEILFRLGLRDEVVGVSPECDYPPEARGKPVVSSNRIDPDRLSAAEIDDAVMAHLREGSALYHVDAGKLEAAEPDLIFTQGLCDVCAASVEDVTATASRLRKRPKVVSLDPTDLDGVLRSIETVGAETGRKQEARELVANLRERLEAVASRVPVIGRVPTVVCLEWFDPLFAAGHWVPEMVEVAGGADVLGVPGKPSHRVEWRDVVISDPEVLILMPCGFGVDRALRDAHLITGLPGWHDLPAVRNGRVYAVDGSSYFSRPGPRVVDGVQLLAHVLHPDRFPGGWPRTALEKVPG